MAFTNSPANVKGPLISAIALAAPAADFTDGVEIGMKKPSKLMVTPNVTNMSSSNPWVDSLKVSLETSGLQNDFATLDAVNTYAETYVQTMMKTAGGAYGAFLGADSDSETLLGLEWEWSFKGNEDEFKYKLIGEVARETYDSLWTESTTKTWTAGVDSSLRARPGVKKVTFGGAPLGQLLSVEGSIKSRSAYMQLGRPLSTGVDVAVKIVLGQTDKDEVTAALAAAKGSDTVIISFWGGSRSLKLTNLLAGKACSFEFGEKDSITIEVKAFFPKGTDRVKINTVAGVFELVFLDNEAEA